MTKSKAVIEKLKSELDKKTQIFSHMKINVGKVKNWNKIYATLAYHATIALYCLFWPFLFFITNLRL